MPCGAVPYGHVRFEGPTQAHVEQVWELWQERSPTLEGRTLERLEPGWLGRGYALEVVLYGQGECAKL